MFTLVVRFDLVPETADEFDRLVAATGNEIRAVEDGTLVYACHGVDGEPNARVFYEVYRDRAAFEEHERQPHVRHFLSERDRLLAKPPRVEFLTEPTGKGMPE